MKTFCIVINVIFIFFYSLFFYLVTIGVIYYPGEINFFIFKKDYQHITKMMISDFPEIKHISYEYIKFKDNNRKKCRYIGLDEITVKYIYPNYDICDNKYNDFFEFLRKKHLWYIEETADDRDSIYLHKIKITNFSFFGGADELSYVYSQGYFKDKEYLKKGYIYKLNDDWGIHSDIEFKF